MRLSADDGPCVRCSALEGWPMHSRQPVAGGRTDRAAPAGDTVGSGGFDKCAPDPLQLSAAWRATGSGADWMGGGLVDAQPGDRAAGARAGGVSPAGDTVRSGGFDKCAPDPLQLSATIWRRSALRPGSWPTVDLLSVRIAAECCGGIPRWDWMGTSARRQRAASQERFTTDTEAQRHRGTEAQRHRGTENVVGVLRTVPLGLPTVRSGLEVRNFVCGGHNIRKGAVHPMPYWTSLLAGWRSA